MTKSSVILLSVTEFNRIFVQYRPRLTFIAYSYVRDMDVADDLVNDSFVVLWENRDKVESSPEAYLYGTLRNKCLAWIRSRQVKLQVHKKIYDTEYRLTEYFISTIESCEPNQLFADEIDAIYRRELNKMPEMTRKIFHTHMNKGKTYAEIARLYGVSERQVKREILRAYDLLRLSLADYLPLLFLFLWMR